MLHEQVRDSTLSVQAADVTVDGSAVVYRLFDVGYAIDLNRALELLSGSAPERVRPVRGEGQALQISNPPITVLLGRARLSLPAERDDIAGQVVDANRAGQPHDVELSARIFDFGVVSVRARITAPARLTWNAFSAFGRHVDTHRDLDELMMRELASLTARMAPAIERPSVADVREEYTVFRITGVTQAGGIKATPAMLAALDVVPLLLDETRALSPDARRELLPHRFSYYSDDLAIVTWGSALVVEPGEGDTDLQYILEFANAQLLELRYYDALLDAELPRVYDSIEAARKRRAWFPGRRFAALLTQLQARVADSTELVERVENAIKVTDDVYLARVYSAALELFRGRVWRAGIDRKLGILRDTYAMLNDEAQSARSETLEIAIVILIVLEIALAIWRH